MEGVKFYGEGGYSDVSSGTSRSNSTHRLQGSERMILNVSIRYFRTVVATNNVHGLGR